ncbi:hypothetical protein [Aeromonas taiwanensis]|uniref:hypothetical protein n=1 Tax=Aeromonas taiwanensis TaxID=633417 RepID=UPI00248DE107|nr:hypothetical protein [Aeromonas taiwanensis]
MSNLMECRACHALIEDDESLCPQCGSTLFGGVGADLAHQLAVKQQQEAFVATYHTWSDGGWEGIGIDMVRHRLAVRFFDGHIRARKIIQGTQVIGVKVRETAGATHTKTQGGSQLGRALVGGVLLGGVGALLGGLSAKQTSTGTVTLVQVLITTQEPDYQLLSITLLAGEFRADSAAVAQARRSAEVWAARVEGLIHQCAAQAVRPEHGSSVADELGKLVWLREHGEITMQEFDLLKRQLLANRDADS